MERSDRTFTGESFEKLKKYTGPRSSFKRTKALETVLDLRKHYKVLHLHGMSGSGKSQILAAMLQELDKDSERIVWHIQCQEARGAVEREWMELVKALRQNNLVTPEIEREMQTAFRQETYDYLTIEIKNMLQELKVRLNRPLLLAIEDITHDEEKNFVKTLVRCMADFAEDDLKMQLFIATQDKYAIYQQLDLDELNIYRTYHVRGFSEQEAFDFLCLNTKPVGDKTKVMELAKELSYSPLGLFVAKQYCLKYDMSYEEFYNSLERHEDVKTQKEIMKEDLELRGKDHRYDIIVKLLTPDQVVDKDELIHNQVIQMMSFMSESHIPTRLIRRFYFYAGERMDTGEQDNFTRVLVKRLETEVDAMVWKKANGENSLTIHSDVFRALRLHLSSEKKVQVLSAAVTALASILDKDNRTRETYLLLHDLKNHAEVLVKHCLEHFEELLREVKVQPKDYQILLGLSKINEVIGFAISQHPGMREGYEEDDFFERAIACIWTVVLSGNTPSILSSLRMRITGKNRKGDRARFLIDYEPGKDPKETAKKAFKLMRDASLASSEMKQILRYDSENSHPLKKENFVDMRRRLGNDATVDWAKLEKEIGEKDGLTERSKEILREHKMLLKWDQLNPYYLAEKMASILHSRGRLDNYKADIIPDEMHARCVWYVTLGLELCDIAFAKTGTKSLFHFILRANNKLPRLVRSSRNETAEEYIERIKQSRDLARSVAKERSDFYEHGVYKHVSGTPWTLMNAGKYMVKANTKLWAKVTPSPTDKKECEELYEVSKNNPDIVISATCLVHVGKYTAATGQYGEALDIFQLAFKQGMNAKIQTNSTAYAWALHNMGRAIVAAGSDFNGREPHIKNFKEKYELTKTNGTPEKWRKILDELHSNIR